MLAKGSGSATPDIVDFLFANSMKSQLFSLISYLKSLIPLCEESKNLGTIDETEANRCSRRGEDMISLSRAWAAVKGGQSSHQITWHSRKWARKAIFLRPTDPLVC